MIDIAAYDIGEHRLVCPACGTRPSKKDANLTVNADRSGVLHCFKCELVQTFRPERGANISNPSKPLIQGCKTGPKHTTLSTDARRLWAECRPLSGVALDYLRARKCCNPPSDGDLRWHPRQVHPFNGYVGPALIARITDAVSGEPISLHHTWIRGDGNKADIERPRLCLGGHRKKGGVIRLWPDEAVSGSLGIAEGIESALSLAWIRPPVWSCVDKGNMAKLPVLDGIEALTIAADGEPGGIAAADECGQRWADAGCTVKILTPKPGYGNDINDVVQKVIV